MSCSFFESGSYLQYLLHTVAAMCPTFKLYIPLFFTVVAFNWYKRDAQLKIIDRPVTEIGYVIHMLLFNGIVCKQHACRIRWDEDQHMPNGVQVWKLLSKICITEKFIQDPAGNGQYHDQCGAQSKPINTLRFFSKNEIHNNIKINENGKESWEKMTMLRMNSDKTKQRLK